MRKPICHPNRKYYANGMCKPCYMKEYHKAHPREQAVVMKRWYAINRDIILEKKRVIYKENKDQILNSKLKRLYSITLREYDLMLELQDGSCAICGKTPEENGKRLAVDHDHETGEVRGLLCNNCNRAIGNFQDSSVICKRATFYLQKYGK